MSNIRLYTSEALSQNITLQITPEQAHYCLKVMRMRHEDQVCFFNGRDGEWIAKAIITKRDISFIVQSQTKQQEPTKELILCSAVVKNTAMKNIIRQATEIGATTIIPTKTERSMSWECNIERFKAIAIEAAEQSGRNTIPNITPPKSLTQILKETTHPMQIIFCNETETRHTALHPKETSSVPVVLIGPEGGFSNQEITEILAHPNTTSISLGSQILKADTATVAALSIVQQAFIMQSS